MNLYELEQWHREQAAECRRVDEKEIREFHLKCAKACYVAQDTFLAIHNRVKEQMTFQRLI